MGLIAELKRRNLMRWALAYVAAAFALLQGVDLVAQRFGWPESIERALIILSCVGFLVALLLAWYHGEPGPQTVTRTESLLLGALLVLGGGLTWQYAPDPRSPAPAAGVATPGAVQSSGKPMTDDNSIAVMPFVNMSSDREQDYFSDGLSEELLNLLAQMPQLRVIARTSSFSFKGKAVDVPTIAKALNVAHVLEGSVRKSGQTLRITVQLIRATDGSHLWSQTYDRAIADVFKVQDEIASAVAAALRVRMLPDQAVAPTRSRTANPEVYNQYLLGRHFNRQLNVDSYKLARGVLQAAVALDPSYAPAQAELAYDEMVLAGVDGDPIAQKATEASARDRIDRVIALDPQLSDGYLMRGLFRINSGNAPGALADYRHALELNPGDSDILRRQADLLVDMGQFDEALRAAERAVAGDPLSAPSRGILGRVCLARGDYPKANQALVRALQLAPGFASVRWDLGVSYLLIGDFAEARRSFEASSEDRERRAGLALVQHGLHQSAEADATLTALVASHGEDSADKIAEVYAWRGQRDQAFDWLREAYEQQPADMQFLRTDPLLAGLRSDPRYAALLRKSGLAD